MEEEKTVVGDDIGEKCRQMYRKVKKGRSLTMIFNGVRVIMFHESDS